MTFVLGEDCDWQGSAKKNSERERLHGASSSPRGCFETSFILCRTRLCQAFFSGQRDVRCEVSGVVSHSEQDPGFTAVQPGHTQEIKAFVFGDAAPLNRIAVLICYRQLHEAEIKFVSGRPNHGFDSRCFE